MATKNEFIRVEFKFVFILEKKYMFVNWIQLQTMCTTCFLKFNLMYFHPEEGN